MADWWRCFAGGLLDELVANGLLHGAFRYRQRPTVHGPREADDPALYSGELTSFFSPRPEPVELFRNRWQPNPVASASHSPGVASPRGSPVFFPASPAFPSGSAFQPAHDDYWYSSSLVTRWPEANTVWLRHWPAVPQSDRGITVVAMHGIVQRGTGWFRRLAEDLVPRGVGVLAVDTPFNYRRTPDGYFPGQLILGGDLGHQLAVTRQAVLDAWQVIRSIQSQGRRVGLVGVSYGGWISLLTSLLAEHLEFVVAVTPPVNTFRLLEEGGTLIRAVRRGLGPGRLDIPWLNRVVRPLIPQLWPAGLPGDRIILHAARCDRFVKSAHIQELASTWKARLREHSDGHYNVTMRPRIIPEVARDILAFTASE